MTPAQIEAFLAEHAHRMDLPQQYLGDEPNSYRKPWDDAVVRWCMVASWPYEHAAGNSSIPAVYQAVNEHDRYLCDRFYLPATQRDLGLLEKNGLGAFGIETKQPLARFDVVGSSISYPVLTMNYIKLLAMSGIPIRWRDRDPNIHPMVIVGGQSFGAPEVLAPVVDCWWLGEVEDEPGNPGIGAVCDTIAAFKAAGRWTTDRLGCYADLARQFGFLYFPRFVDVHYGYEDRSHVGVGPHLSKQVTGYTSTVDGMRLPFRRRYIRNLDDAKPLTRVPLLYSDPAMGSGDLEVGRGCPAWCSFCALTYRQKPYRQRSIGNIVGYAQEYADNMGSVRMAPFAPDFPMYTQRKRLIRSLLENVSDEVDAPAMRVDDFVADNEFILLQVHGVMDSVTLGVEGSSQRMRDLVGKGTADADIKEAVARGIRAGIRKFKLFLIHNLPGEDENDVYRVLKLAKELADIRESMRQPTVRIQFSWTPLLIEANTPFQWFAPPSPSRVLGYVWDEFRNLKIDFKLGSKSERNKSVFFQLCQRASRDVGEALVDAIEEVDQACWGGVPRNFEEILERKLQDHGFRNGLADCFDERFKDDLFGWEFIDQGVSSELLWVTYLQMREFIEQTDSATYDYNYDASYHGSEWIERCDTRCQGKTCGACDYKDLRIRARYIQDARGESPLELSTVKPIDQRTQAQRVRLRIHRPERYRMVDNSHWRFAARRAAFRAQRALDWPDGIAKRSIMFASDDIQRDWVAGLDYVEFAFTCHHDRADVSTFITAMARELQPHLSTGDWVLHPTAAPNLRADAGSALYDLEVDADAATVADRIAAWNRTSHIPLRLRGTSGYFGPAVEEVNARDFVDDLWLIKDGTRLVLRALVRGRPNVYAVYAALMGQPSWIDAARRTAIRWEVFRTTDLSQQDFLRPNCVDCGWQIPTTMLDHS